jgi:hypothetical protein
VRAAFEAGSIGADQVATIARAYANPRIRRRVLAQDAAFASMAATMTHRLFDATVRHWIHRVDEDGTTDRSQRNHDNRDFRHTQDFDGGWQTTGRCGSVDGIVFADIFNAFHRGELDDDWAKARAEHGDAATVDDLPRTPAQRRWDALMAMAHAAADAHAATPGGSTIVTSLVMDMATFERHARRMAGAPVDHTTNVAPDADDGYRCDTVDGLTVDPCEAVAATLISHVRRVVIGADSVVIDQGRKQRLFTGAAQTAVKLSARWCLWPGCHVPASRCQCDHLDPWVDPTGRSPGGATNPANGANTCGRHNRHKQRGYTVHRDEHGHLHTTRPDGTEIQ